MITSLSVLNRAPALLALPVFLLFARDSIAQEVTFDTGSRSTYGVSVLRKGLIGFEAEADAINKGGRGGPPLEETLKPFLLIVRNESPTPIVRLVVRCVLEYEGRAPMIWTHTMVHGATNPAERIQQGQSVVLFPGITRTAPGYAAGDPDQLRELSGRLQLAKKVSVGLDAVIFADGRLVGPDRSGSSVRYQIEQDALRELIREFNDMRGKVTEAALFRDRVDQLSKLKPRATVPLPELERDRDYYFAVTQRGLAQIILLRKFSLSESIDFLFVSNRNVQPLQ
ncbi:MAG: hypothetical protein NTV52_25730 [Acidobacteria bacterium]|nr:hypothetical protein [Acidobacteriota bacterium]